jgi:hypothetical protein
VLIIKYYSGDKIKEGVMGGKCGMYDTEREMHTGFLRETSAGGWKSEGES